MDTTTIATVLPVVNSIATPWYVIIAFYLLGIVGLFLRVMLKTSDPSWGAMVKAICDNGGSLVKQAITWLIVYGIWASMRWWVLPPSLGWLTGVVVSSTWRGAYWAAPFVAWLSDSIIRAILGFISKLIAAKTGTDVPVEP
jgi:hypothetical protein